jgi:hypothetical protein
MSNSDALIRFWYIQIPRSLAPLAPRVASAVGDGSWTAVWVRIAAWAPVIAFGVGFFVPHTWPGTEVVYAESPFFLALAAALSMFSGTLGVAFLLAEAVREALSRDLASNLSAFLHAGAGQFVAWLLLGVLIILLPLLAHLVTEAVLVRLRVLRNRDVRAVGRSLLLAVTYPCLVLLWCQAATVLLRPVFTWSAVGAPLHTVWTVGAWWPWLAAAAGGAAFARGILEGIVAPRMRGAPAAAALALERRTSMRRSGHAWTTVPVAPRVALAIAGMTTVLAGLYERATDGLWVCLVIGVLATLPRRPAGWRTERWIDGVQRVPAAIRVAIALGIGYLLALLMIEFGSSVPTLRVTMIGTLLTLALLFVVFPVGRELPSNPRANGAKVRR